MSHIRASEAFCLRSPLTEKTVVNRNSATGGMTTTSAITVTRTTQNHFLIRILAYMMSQRNSLKNTTFGEMSTKQKQYSATIPYLVLSNTNKSNQRSTLTSPVLVYQSLYASEGRGVSSHKLCLQNYREHTWSLF